MSGIPRCMEYKLQQPLKEELECIWKQQIIPLGVDEMAEWWNIFMMVP